MAGMAGGCRGIFNPALSLAPTLTWSAKPDARQASLNLIFIFNLIIGWACPGIVRGEAQLRPASLIATPRQASSSAMLRMKPGSRNGKVVDCASIDHQRPARQRFPPPGSQTRATAHHLTVSRSARV